ncbi:hypothetical protein J2Z69_001844 [Paenibacillus shirakamiensis]|uniref:ABC transporter permease n=1 Tax=Paenibacillus shirakamiensis TaxID=1265935 RepID=A0ABS4JGH1_9BACL|nr:hypothetical protein [Paenibacillus shirakamiensis]
MRYLRSTLDEFSTWKWSMLFVLLFIFGSSQRQLLIQSSITIQSSLNQWDILIGVSGDPMILLYLILPFMMLLSILTIRETWNSTYFIRLQSWRNWMEYTITRFAPVVIVSTILIMITSLLLTLGLPYEANWSLFSTADLSTFNQISSLAKASNLSPYFILILQMGILSCFLLSLHALMASFYLYFSNSMYIGIISFVLYVYSLITFRYFPEFPKLIIFNYMTFASSYGAYHAVYPAFVTTIGIIIMAIYIVPLLKKWR